MGAGLPTIVYNISPFDLLIPSDKVIKIEENCNESLKYKLLGLLSTDQRKNFGLRGQKFVFNTFTLEKMTNNYYDLLNN